MKTLPLLILSLVSAAAPVMAREWTNTSGKKLEADFVEKKGAEGSEIAVVKTAAGKTFEIPVSTLSAEDQAFLKTQAKAEPKTAAPSGKTENKPAGLGTKPAAAAAPSAFQKLLDGKLVALDGKKISKYSMKEEPRFYAFYFSAHWCPPCRAFTPKLVEFYNAAAGKKKDFEIVFVSSDNSEEEMETYIKEDSMPWPVVSYRNLARMKDIKKYCGNGIPCLVLVDRDGKVISDSYENGNYVGPGKVMDEIPEKTKTPETASN